MLAVPIPGLASRLRQARDRRGLSQPAAARHLGCSHQWLEQLENGKRPPSLAWAARLAGLYLVSLDWLVGGDPTPGRS